jgi:hypothetical protein
MKRETTRKTTLENACPAIVLQLARRLRHIADFELVMRWPTDSRWIYMFRRTNGLLIDKSIEIFISYAAARLPRPDVIAATSVNVWSSPFGATCTRCSHMGPHRGCQLKGRFVEHSERPRACVYLMSRERAGEHSLSLCHATQTNLIKTSCQFLTPDSLSLSLC